MKRLTAFAILSVLYSFAVAAPTLTSDPYASGAGQPTTATLTVTGMAIAPITCTLKVNTDNSVQPICDLGSITAPGTYPLVLMVSNLATIYNSPDGTGATYTVGGSASTPFSYVVKQGLASNPAKLRLTP